MTKWVIDECGNRTFAHAGWTVKVWYTDEITVESPHEGEEVEVSDEGIWVNGTAPGSAWSGPIPSAFTIPWPVIGVIIEARQIVYP